MPAAFAPRQPDAARSATSRFRDPLRLRARPALRARHRLRREPHWIDHSRQTLDLLEGQISAEYREATIDRWYAGRVPDDRVHRLYFGATFDDRFHGMFSFFPCIVIEGDSPGFARPDIRLPGVVTPTQTQKYRLTELTSPREAEELWRAVVEQVLEAGLRLGVCTHMPRRAESATPARQSEPSGCAAPSERAAEPPVQSC